MDDKTIASRITGQTRSVKFTTSGGVGENDLLMPDRALSVLSRITIVERQFYGSKYTMSKMDAFRGFKATTVRYDCWCVANVASLFPVSKRRSAATFPLLSAAQSWSCDVGK